MDRAWIGQTDPVIAIATKVDDTRRRTRQIEASLLAEPASEKATTTKRSPRIEYRVIENHLVKFEEGQAPYIYSMPYDLDQH